MIKSYTYLVIKNYEKIQKEKSTMKMRKIISLLMAGVLAAGIASCGTTTTEQQTGTDTGASANTEVSGKVAMNGSTSMQKLASALTESFMAKYPKVTATAEFTGSSTGIEKVASGSCDIGNSSRSLKDEEKAKGLVENIVAIDGIAVVVDKQNTVSDLTKEQLTKIYTGEVKNWSEVGGSDGQIIVIGREAGSGTRGAFEEILKVENKCKYAQEIDSTGAVMAKVASTKGAVGYVSLDVVDDTVKAVSLDGVEPTAENIKAGKYFLSRPFVMATKGAVSEQSAAVQAMFDYIDSDEGQAIIKKVGLISAK